MIPIYKLVHSMANKQRREFDRITYDKPYSAAQARILNYLLDHSTQEIFQKDIEQEFDLRPPSATSLLQSMEKSGLIRRETSTADARFKRIVCSESAYSYNEQISRSLADLTQKLSRNISPADLETWRKVTIQIINNLE